MLRTAALLLCALVCLPLAAVEPAAPTPPATESSSERAAAPSAKQDKKESPRAAPSTPAEFDPSEEISEDLSVPFPVDI